MADLKTRFRGADRIPAPHLWGDITGRDPSSVPPGPSPARRILVAAFAMVIAVAAITFAIRAIGGGTSRPMSEVSPQPIELKVNGLIYFQLGGGDGGTWTDAIQADGSGRTRIFGQDRYVSHIAWSPDGTKIAYVGIVQYGNQSADGQAHFGILVANPDGSHAQPLTDGVNEGWPTWSPDGAQIAFSSSRADPSARECASGTQSSCPTDIYIMNADGSSITRLTDDPAPEYAPAWSPDGSKIAFVRTQSDTNVIEVMNADGIGTTAIASGTIAGLGGVEHPFSWSPDGSQIVFMRVAGASSEIDIVNADGAGERKIFGSEGVVSEDPIWSPDGTQIAFSSTFGVYPPGCGVESDVCSDLFVMRADGSHLTRLTQGANGVGGIAWQPLPAQTSPAITQSPALTSVSDPVVSATVKVGESPGDAIAVGEGGVWVAVQGSGSGDRVVRIDPRTNNVVATIPVDSSPWDIAVGAGSVWVTGYGENKSAVLQRIDPTTNQVVATITVAPSGHPGPVAAGDDAVWVDVGDTESDSLVRIDPATNRVVATVPLPGPASAYEHDLQVVGQTVWVQQIVSTQGGNSDHGGDVIRIDGTTNQVVATIPAHAQNMATGPDSVWVSDRPGTPGAGWILSEIDPQTNQIIDGPFSLPDGSGGFGPMYVDQAGVWLDGYDEQERVQVIHVDARTHEIDASTKPIQSYDAGAAFDPTTRSFWVTAPLGAVTRLDLT